MSIETTDTEQQKFREELSRYWHLFADAFDELHRAVVQQAKKNPGQHIIPHHDYPVMSQLNSGFPAFDEVGFYGNKGPLHYVSTVRPRGLLGLLSGINLPKLSFPKGAELASFLRTHEIGKRLDLNRPLYMNTVSDLPVDQLVGDAVERYLHLYGLDAPIEEKRRDDVIQPLIVGTIEQSLALRLVVPITLTNFEVDRFPLTETTYIARIPRKLQLARATMSTVGSGAVQMVVGAATHAFVSQGWNLEVDKVDDVRPSLNQSSSNALDAIDSFFSALRVATGINTMGAKRLGLEFLLRSGASVWRDSPSLSGRVR